MLAVAVAAVAHGISQATENILAECGKHVTAKLHLLPKPAIFDGRLGHCRAVDVYQC